MSPVLKNPGMLYDVLVRSAGRLSARSASPIPSLAAWKKGLPQRRRQWLGMLGLDPLPRRENLQVQVTRRLDRGDHVVEALHFQPVPHCRIAANLYRPKLSNGPLPAIVYVCGHSSRGKFHYQAHARWFARHGYVCLILDAIQHGENDGVHHGTYAHGRWHWYSQGYSPIAVEVWAAMRAADLLLGRDDVDPDRLGITGNSGGGTVSWFTAAADPRFRVVAPSCQTGSAFQHIRDRTIDGHCDCTFWINTLGWDLPDVACLVAPRPLLVAAASADVLFRPYAYREVVRRARRLYRAYGCPRDVALCEAETKHGYSPRLRQTIFNWFEKHLKQVSRPSCDDIDPDDVADRALQVYPSARPPIADGLKTIDERFIPLPAATVAATRPRWLAGQRRDLARLRALTFRQIPARIAPAAATCRRQGQDDAHRFSSFDFMSEPGMAIRMHLALPLSGPRPCPVLVGPLAPEARTPFCATGAGLDRVDPVVAGFACVEVRGTGSTSMGPGLEWTVRRSMPIVGQTLYERQTFDLLSAIRVLRRLPGIGSVATFGSGRGAALAIYAALLDPEVAECVLHDPVASHWGGGPEFLSVLRTGDLPHNLSLLLPRTLSFVGGIPRAYASTRLAYRRFAAPGRFRTFATLAGWTPGPAAG